MNLNELQSLNIGAKRFGSRLKYRGGIGGLNKQELIVKILETHEKGQLFFCQRCFRGNARWLWFSIS